MIEVKKRMRLGILTRNPDAWCSLQIRRAMERRGARPVCFRFSELKARVSMRPVVEIRGRIDISELPAILVRPIGRGSLDEIIFRLDVLHRLERLGIIIINSPSTIEKAVDKYYALTLLEEAGVPVPRTVVCEDARQALEAFDELGGDIVLKPIFGSRGLGITRISDREVARRTFRALSFLHNVLYLQEFVAHGNRDIRAFVVGDRLVASMYRVAKDWKTNISQGATAVPLRASSEIEKLAVKSAGIIGCEIAGVDILESQNGLIVNEVNSQPGFRGLQTVTKVDIAGEVVDHIIRRLRS
jgi:RimK family alpha-L-glutamate ligase